MTRIEIYNRQRSFPIDRGLFGDFATKALGLCLEERGPGHPFLAELPSLEISLLGARAISRIHREFFQDPSPTDVITFPHGEILLGVPEILRNARQFAEKPGHELERCLVHGLLHLQGFEDDSPDLRNAMFARQEAILKKLWKP